MDVRRAVLGRLEEDRVDEPDERDVGDAVVRLEIGDVSLLDLERAQLLLLLRHGSPCAEGLRGADELADRGEDVLARRDPELERLAGRQSQLVDPVQVRRVRDRDAQRAVPVGVRNGDDALEHVQRHFPRGRDVELEQLEVDEGKLVARCEHPRDAVARGNAFLDERVAERARVLRAPARHRELVLGDEPRRGKQVDHELDGLVHAVRRGQRLRRRPGGSVGSERREVGFLVAHREGEVAGGTIDPSNELSAHRGRSLRERSPFRGPGER